MLGQSMHFMALSGKFLLFARKTCSQDLYTFSLSGTIVSHCGHTLLGGMIATHETGERLFSPNEKQNGRFPPHSRIKCTCAVIKWRLLA